MTSTRRKLWAAAAAAVVAALALTGCSSGGGGSSSGSPLPDAQQNLTYLPSAFALNLNIPANPAEPGVNNVISQVMEPLVKYDGKKASPSLATSWSWTTPTTLQFKLRKDVTFSNGDKFTAEDVKATFDAYIAAKAPAFTSQFAPITGYTADDDYTFTITTKQPVGTLIGFLAFVYIVDGKHVGDADYWNAPIGTGPFVITDYVANDHVTMTRNDDYWGQKAKLKKLTFKKVTDVSARLTALSNNEAQVVGDVPSDQISQVKGMDGVSFVQADSLNYYFIWFENQHSPLDDVDVRKALFEAIDVPTIAKAIFGDGATPMTSLCPPAAFGCVKTTLPSYDPKDAKALLAKAGYPDGLTLDQDILFSNTGGSSVNDLVPALISAWKAIGVTVKPRGVDQATWLADFTALNWDLETQVNQTLTGDADYTLNRLYSCAAKRLGYCNPQVDSLLSQAQQSTDQDARLKLYEQATKLLSQDLPFIPLLNLKVNAATRSTVKGLSIPPTEFIDFSKVSLG
jgi:peptide/nickel transport system substrate-binding protein